MLLSSVQTGTTAVGDGICVAVGSGVNVGVYRDVVIVGGAGVAEEAQPLNKNIARTSVREIAQEFFHCIFPFT